MGSPEFAIPTLKKLNEEYQVVGVVTQPDRPAGRGRTLTPPPIKVLADQLGIPTIQPRRMKDEGVFDQLINWQPDVIVVAAFGQILRQNVLDLAPFGCINVHASYLPRWRGAAPIQAAIVNGDEYTGVSIMKLDPGIDTGPVLTKEKVEIRPDDTAVSLEQRLASIGAELLLKTLPGYLDGSILPQAQDESQATYASMLNKDDGLLDFNLPAITLERKIRGYYDWPGAFFCLGEQKIKIRKAKIIANQYEPGERTILEGYPVIGTQEGALQLIEIQPAGKNWMNGKDYLRGNPNWVSRER